MIKSERKQNLMYLHLTMFSKINMKINPLQKKKDSERFENAPTNIIQY